MNLLGCHHVIGGGAFLGTMEHSLRMHRAMMSPVIQGRERGFFDGGI